MDTNAAIRAIIEDLESRAEDRACCGDAREANELRHRAQVLRTHDYAEGAYIATIERSGEPGRCEPVAILERDGGRHDQASMPMGWNMGSAYQVGMTGYAFYVRTANAGLWQFHPYSLHPEVVA